MLKSMHVENFTVFKDAEITFSPQINVIVGENGVGKTHLLKLAYAMLAADVEVGKRTSLGIGSDASVSKLFADKLVNVFMPRPPSDLIRLNAGAHDGNVALKFDDEALNFRIILQRLDGGYLALTPSKPKKFSAIKPVYIPMQELLSIYPGFVSMYETHHLRFDETWRDTCNYLGMPKLRGEAAQKVEKLIEPLEKLMGGKIILDERGQFCLDSRTQGRIGVDLVGKGFCKIGMLAQLIANGVLTKGSYLFWDEPEIGLHPGVMPILAPVIFELGKYGVQIFISSHSRELLTELDRLGERQNGSVQFITLSRLNDGIAVKHAKRFDNPIRKIRMI